MLIHSFHSSPLWKCDLAKLRNQLRSLRCILPKFGKHDVRGPGTRNADVGSRSKTDIVTPYSWSTVPAQEQGRQLGPAPTTAMENGDPDTGVI
jgi:hypothetical protein